MSSLHHRFSDNIALIGEKAPNTLMLVTLPI